MRISDDEKKLNSVKGMLGTILVYVLLFAFSYRKLRIFYLREQDNTTQHLSIEEIDQKEEFSIKNGFNFAVAVSSFSSDISEIEIDPSYGKLQFRENNWGIDMEGKIFWQRKILKSHLCS